MIILKMILYFVEIIKFKKKYNKNVNMDLKLKKLNKIKKWIFL